MGKAIIQDIVVKENVKKVFELDKRSRLINSDDLSFLKKVLLKTYNKVKRNKENLIKDIRYILNYVNSRKSEFVVLEIAGSNYLFIKN